MPCAASRARPDSGECRLVRLDGRSSGLVGRGRTARRGARSRRRRARSASGPRAAGSSKRESTCRETISGSVESGRPTPTRTRLKSPPPRCCFSALQAVVPGEPAAHPGLDLAERQVDLVVDRDHVVERRACTGRARAPPPAPTRSCRSGAAAPRRAARRARSRPSVTRPPKGLRALGRSQRAASSFATSKPTLCRVPAYFEPGLPSPTIRKSTGTAGRLPRPRNRRRQGPYLLAAPRRTRLPRPRPRRRAPPRPPAHHPPRRPARPLPRSPPRPRPRRAR